MLCRGFIGVRWFRCGVLACLLVLTAVGRGEAAELRIDFAELAKIAQKLLVGAKIRIHNAPGGLMGGLFNEGASLSLGSVQKQLEFKPFRFNLLESIYELYVNEVNSSEFRVAPVGGALRLTVRFQIEGPAVIGACVEGPCTFAGAIPDILWTNSGLTADLVPVRYNGGVSLQIKRVQLLGVLEPRCKAGAGFLLLNTCRTLAVPQARRKIAMLPSQIDEQVKRFNEADIQKQIADGMKPSLSLGPVGEVQISNVVVDASGVVVSFRFSNLP